MKQFIVMAAVLPLLLTFMVQFGIEMRVADIKQDTTEIVYEYAEYARLNGGFMAIKNDLKAALAIRMKVNLDKVFIKHYDEYEDLDFSGPQWEAGEVFMYLDDGPKYKGYGQIPGEFIRYKVVIKIHDVVAGAGLLGIDDATVPFTIEGRVLSERLRP
jgi:hypothetical protein